MTPARDLQALGPGGLGEHTHIYTCRHKCARAHAYTYMRTHACASAYTHACMVAFHTCLHTCLEHMCMRTGVLSVAYVVRSVSAGVCVCVCVCVCGGGGVSISVWVVISVRVCRRVARIVCCRACVGRSRWGTHLKLPNCGWYGGTEKHACRRSCAEHVKGWVCVAEACAS